MSLNQITVPNTYVPSVSFQSLSTARLSTDLISSASNILVTNENLVPSIQLNTTAGQGLKLLSFNAVGYSASNFNCYTTTVTPVLLTGFTTPEIATIHLTRIGNVVFYKIDGINAIAAGGVVTVPPNTLLQVYRPSVLTEGNVPLTSSNTVLSSGTIGFTTSGGFDIKYQPGVFFAANPDSGWTTFSGSYIV